MNSQPKTPFDPEFVAALCHDLRGPLGAIGTWVHVLNSNRATPETQARALASMTADVKVLGGFIEQLSMLGSGPAAHAGEKRAVDLVPMLSTTRGAAASD